MNKQALIESIRRKKSFLCIGLDSDFSKLPPHLQGLPDAQFEFNKQIIDATREYCVCYKPNAAFYESQGAKGWETLEKTVAYIGDSHFVLMDAKRGDIGNTAEQYAKAFFENMNCDAVTLSPYIGGDAIKPFTKYQDKFAVILALTSNESAAEFQISKSEKEISLFERVVAASYKWGNDDSIMFVVGATKTAYLQQIRKLAPLHFLLVPGVGTQGGSLAEVAHYGMNNSVGLLVNVSRQIIFASEGTDFATKAAEVAKNYQQQMAAYL